MKALILISLLATTLSPQTIERVTVYGSDDRMNYYEADEISKALAKSTVMLVEKKDLRKIGDYYEILSPTLKKEYGLRDDQRFVNELTPGFCSGFVASSTTIVTAAHCVAAGSFFVPCDKTYIVFDYFVEKEGDYPTKIKAKGVFECKKIVHYEWDHTAGGPVDYAIVELSTPTDRPPLAIARNFTLKKGDKVFVIGYPSGLPVKITKKDKAWIREVGGTYFITNLDTFGGNSGSPVFDERTLKVVGIVKSGDTDYINGRVYQVDDNKGSGETITKTTTFSKYIPVSELEKYLDLKKFKIERPSPYRIRPAVYIPGVDKPEIKYPVYQVPDPQPGVIKI